MRDFAACHRFRALRNANSPPKIRKERTTNTRRQGQPAPRFLAPLTSLPIEPGGSRTWGWCKHKYSCEHLYDSFGVVWKMEVLSYQQLHAADFLPEYVPREANSTDACS